MFEEGRHSTDASSAAGCAAGARMARAMADQALAQVELRGHEHVLVVGCGDGRTSAHVATRLVPHGSVCGIDRSVERVAFAQREHADIANLHFRVLDARRLPFDGSFDAAMSFNTLRCATDLKPALRSLRAALVPDGRAWVRLATRGRFAGIECVAEQLCREPAWAGSVDDPVERCLLPDAEQVATQALGVGLGVLSMRTRLEHWDFGSVPELIAHCRARLAAWTRRLPADRREAFVRSVVERHVAAGRDGGRVVLRFYQTDLALTRA